MSIVPDLCRKRVILCSQHKITMEHTRCSLPHFKRLKLLFYLCSGMKLLANTQHKDKELQSKTLANGYTVTKIVFVLKFSGRGISSLPIPHPLRLGRLDARAFGARLDP